MDLRNLFAGGNLDQSNHLMNIHHLELFYYVRGSAESPRPCAISLTASSSRAVSGQVAQLEEFLGVPLFQRRPFELTPQGRKLYEFIQPFFEGLEGIASDFSRGRTDEYAFAPRALFCGIICPSFFQVRAPPLQEPEGPNCGKATRQRWRPCS